MIKNQEFSLSCPFPIQNYPHVLLAHGGGGRFMHQLIEKMFLAGFENPVLLQRHDAAILNRPSARIAFTTDSYVISPLFFPGGNIGDLAVNGTVNDLAMAGARPLYLSSGFILEEGLAMDTLWRVIDSMRKACQKAGVFIVTGDTKVVGKGKGDGIFINTAGIGVIEHDLTIGPLAVRDGDAIIVNGDLGAHGMAIMAQRESLSFESAIESDTAPLADMVLDLIAHKINVHCLRDLTRGGLASALNEIVMVSKTKMQIVENAIPVREDVASACEMLGLDPLYVANEGRMVAFVPADEADQTVDVMRRHPQGQGACIIGHVSLSDQPLVVMKSKIGAHRIIDMISGEQLPRIC
ncbi:MAG: hydrogenase expression/formation protein HypE [Candidatus Omnitrophica bacterium]|nr:hydrogenase expression/formation protein HypE [Candidatus Omnitrophota bacterium]